MTVLNGSQETSTPKNVVQGDPFQPEASCDRLVSVVQRLAASGLLLPRQYRRCPARSHAALTLSGGGRVRPSVAR